ncbi:MAG: DsbA family oxidoreductase [Betaproteobacteria bacterium]|nr:MAG: DsbA family oxidoreductase [Betaproteobacteria bacterium]
MQIDIISDVVCPWCFIGKRHLEKALAQYASAHPDAEAPKIIWHPFQLNPQLPVEGMPRKEYLDSKFGGAERAREIYDRVAQAGKAADIDFRFDDIQAQPNTVDAHQLILLAQAFDAQDGVVESLFNGYFLEGRDLRDRQTLVELAERGSLPRDDADRCLETRQLRKHVEEQQNHALSLGVQGVPFFIFDQKLAASGAQPAEVLVEAMEQAASAPPVEADA